MKRTKTSGAGASVAFTVLALAVAGGHAAPAQASEVAVRVRGIDGAAGTVLIAACSEPRFLRRPCEASNQVPAAAAAGPIRLDLPPGRYAVQVLHDANDNGELDRGTFGIPSEGYGFSRNPAPLAGPPDFEAAAVELNGEPVELVIELFYWRL